MARHKAAKHAAHARGTIQRGPTIFDDIHEPKGAAQPSAATRPADAAQPTSGIPGTDDVSHDGRAAADVQRSSRGAGAADAPGTHSSAAPDIAQPSRAASASDASGSSTPDATPHVSSAARKHTKRRIIIGIAAALAVAIAAGSGGIYWYHTSQAHAAALEQCTSARKQLDTKLNTLNTALTAAQPLTQAGTDSVDDPATVSTLASAAKDSAAKATQYGTGDGAAAQYQCSADADTATLHSRATAIDAASRDAAKRATAITDSATAVTRSKANKTNAGIRYTLKAAVSQSRGWLAQTDGKVSDETTRATLQNRVDTAQRMLDGPEVITDAAQYQTAIDQLNDGMDKVVASNITKLGVDCTKEQCVALTFDDGPNATNTPPVIEALKKTGTVATFFNCGGVIDGTTAPLIKELHDMGNPIENHTWTHPHLQTLSRADVRSQLTQTSEKVEQTVGVYPSMIRPPYSEWSDDVRDEAVAMNSSIVNFDVMGYDWARDATQVHDTVMQWTRGGSIVLLHDLQGSTAASIESIITDLKARGFVFVTIPQLLGYNPKPGYVYYSQHTVVKPGEPWRESSYFSDQW